MHLSARIGSSRTNYGMRKFHRKRSAAIRCYVSGEANPRSTAAPKRLCVFVSGGGSNLKAIHKSCLDGGINGNIVVWPIINSGGLFSAQLLDTPSHDMKVLVYPAHGAKTSESLPPGVKLSSPEDLTRALHVEWQIDFVILAGFLKLVPQSTVAAFTRRMVNIHPGLLPAFGGKGMYGSKVHKAVIASGCRYSGPTVHYVDEEYDTGPILAQRIVPCYPTDSAQTLATRVLQEEHRLYPEVVAALCDDRIQWRDDGIPYIWTAV